MSAFCRFCNHPLSQTFCDLGNTPLSNSYIPQSEAKAPQSSYPLHAFVCNKCLLVQLQEFEKPEVIFNEYCYFSSYSDSWLQHAKSYVNEMTKRFGFNQKSLVIEVASNDGYLLQYFKEQEIPILGIEPAENVARVAEEKGIPTLTEFFGMELASRLKKEGRLADLLIGNNVLAHVPDLNDFVGGIKIALSPSGIATLEFPHLLSLIEENQFDTIYHEHFSYFSFYTAEAVFKHHGLKLFDVETLKTHGGSLRIFAAHEENHSAVINERVEKMRQLERAKGLISLEGYVTFDKQAKAVKSRLFNLLQELKKEGMRVAAYGAPAKGNTLLNYCGLDTRMIDFTVDRSPHKQGKFLPGSLIPIYSPEKIIEMKPDYLIILPWNLREEIMQQTQYIREWGGQYIVPIPQPQVIP